MFNYLPYSAPLIIQNKYLIDVPTALGIIFFTWFNLDWLAVIQYWEIKVEQNELPWKIREIRHLIKMIRLISGVFVLKKKKKKEENLFTCYKENKIDQEFLTTWCNMHRHISFSPFFFFLSFAHSLHFFKF